MTSQMAWYTSLLDLDLDSARLDLRLGFGSERPAADFLEYWAHFTTDASVERVREMMTLQEKGCYASHTTRAAIPVLPRLALNGTEIPYTPSPAPPAFTPGPPNGPDAFHVDGSVSVVDTYWREATSEGFTIFADEAPVRGGTGKAPSPLRYFLLGTGFGLGNQLVWSARQLAFQLEHFEIDVEAVYDSRSNKLALGTLYVGQLWFKYSAKLQSPESPDRARQLLDHAHWNCRTLDTLRHPVPLIPHIVVNDREIEYSLPRLPPAETARALWGPELDDAIRRFNLRE